MSTVSERVCKIKEEIACGNGYGERVTLVAATKMQSVETINEAIRAGVDAIAENKAQEFRDKNDLLLPCPRHFIGHLQTNKLKYLVGKVELFHSCDRDELAEELALLSRKRGVCSEVLVQINIGEEASKGGYSLALAKQTLERLSRTEGLCVKGVMAMLPDREDERLLRELASKMRTLYEWAKANIESVEYLSMGMSGDYKLCMEEGSNMIRLGSTLFGARNYG